MKKNELEDKKLGGKFPPVKKRKGQVLKRKLIGCGDDKVFSRFIQQIHQ